MQETTNQYPQERLQQVNEVYQIFKDFFGEEYTDLQVRENRTPEIYVWWPEVTVTNENNRSVVIKDLYAKIPVSLQGMIPVQEHGFYLTRSTYSSKQWRSGYCHSHVPSFRYNTTLAPDFTEPCLGTGPIKHTITCLKTDNDMALWMMFCQELALYVTVESLRGIPYIKLESIGSYNHTDLETNNYDIGYMSSRLSIILDSNLYKEMIRQFTMYYMEHGHITFDFCDNHFIQNTPYYEFMIDISNSFIEWFNREEGFLTASDLYTGEIIKYVKVCDGTFYKYTSLTPLAVNTLSEQRILIFKGQDIMLKIDELEETSDTPTLLLNHDLAMYILKIILKIINYRYTNEHNNNTGTAGSQEASAPAYQTVLYI